MQLNVQLLLTGSELMSGDIVDTNSVFMSQELLDRGIETNRKVVVPDDLQQLTEEIRQISEQADVLIVNGGLGPTTDDMTAEALAMAAGVSLETNEESLLHLESWCNARGFSLDNANRKQAVLPSGIDVLPNPVGSAVGFAMTVNNCRIYCTPGVPAELKRMWADSVLPGILEQYPDDHFSKTLYFPVFGVGEAPVQNRLSKVKDWPENVEIGYRAAPPVVDVKLTIRKPEHQEDLERAEQALTGSLGAHIITDEKYGLAGDVVRLLSERGQTVTCAESCTGGKIASLLTEIPGASAVFEAGYVTYSNAVKQNLLGVPETILEAHGAVSEETVKSMLNGALRISGADYGVSVSGVAGPGGGTDEKPVGTVWIAWGCNETMKTRKLYYPASRRMFQLFIASAALDLIRRDILNIEEEPAYFSRSRR